MATRTPWEYQMFYSLACGISNRLKKAEKEYSLEERIELRNRINLELGIYSEEYCIFLICRAYNIPYVISWAESSIKRYKDEKYGNTPLSAYISQVNGLGNQKGKSYNSFLDGITEYTDVGAILTAPNGTVITDELRKKWGYNWATHEYDFLEYEYADLSSYVEETPVQSRLLKQICILELKIRNGQEKELPFIEQEKFIKQWQELFLC